MVIFESGFVVRIFFIILSLEMEKGNPFEPPA